eukprot:362548-Chlamydomonas_euryale.AAC.8
MWFEASSNAAAVLVLKRHKLSVGCGTASQHAWAPVSGKVRLMKFREVQIMKQSEICICRRFWVGTILDFGLISCCGRPHWQVVPRLLPVCPHDRMLQAAYGPAQHSRHARSFSCTYRIPSTMSICSPGMR